VLPGGMWSISGYRRGTNYIQGYTNVGDFAVTLGYGIKGRAEIFGSFLLDTRVDRDTRPLFFADPKIGGIVDRYPRIHQGWNGNNLGDAYVGLKWNLLSQADQKSAAVALRGMAKLPTGKDDVGVSTGKLDTMFDLIVSKEVSRVIELSGFGGYEFRGSPSDFDIPNGAFRWGVGAGSPTRFPLRIFGELSGAIPTSDTASASPSFVGIDNSKPPAVSDTENITRLTFGLTFQAKNGFFFGGGLSQNLPTEKRNLALASEGSFTDYADWQFRIGYHPGVRKYVAPPPPPPPPAPIAAAPPAPPPAHTLSVKAACDLCSVEVNKVSTVTATVTDSINCAVTYAWTAPAGTFTNPTARTTPWTAPGTPGNVPVTVKVTCPTDGMTASDTVTIAVTTAVVKTYAFDDVYFDFDRSTLRPEALRVLDEAVSAMQADATLSLTIEGNTCNIGTGEYNLALGERRATAVREYFVSRGIAAGRLRTVSYGEEKPKYDNEREETRRLNRRAALVVNLQRQ
jgi:outer membrane protein OmpA-like peptidoglycan-associated protein